MNSSYTQFYEGMLDEQRVADMSSKGGLGLADMVVKQLSPETFTHQDGRVLKMPQRTERTYKPYQPPTAAADDLIAVSKVGKDFAEKEMAEGAKESHGLTMPHRPHRSIPPMGQVVSEEGSASGSGGKEFDTPEEFVNRRSGGTGERLGQAGDQGWRGAGDP